MPEQDRPETRYNGLKQKRSTLKKLCFLLMVALVILIMLLLCAVSIHRKPHLNDLRAQAKLAKLPESVKNLKVDTRPVMSKGRPVPHLGYLFVKFQAEPNDINNFIANSPSVDKNSIHPLFPLPTNSGNVPTWWSMEQSTLNRIYISLEQKATHGGTAFIYGDTNTVRIIACYATNPQLRDSQQLLEDFMNDSEDYIEDLYHEGKDLLLGD